MKSLLSVNHHSHGISLALLLARVGITAFMLTHGLPKLALLLSGTPVSFPAVLGMSAQLSLALTVFAEVFCSLLILVGLATRLAAIPLILTMGVAVMVIHAADPFAQKELALQYLLMYAVLLVAGSGKYSLDYLLSRRSRAVASAPRRRRVPQWEVFK